MIVSRALVAILRAAGHSWTAIARDLGVSRTAVFHLAKQREFREDLAAARVALLERAIEAPRPPNRRPNAPPPNPRPAPPELERALRAAGLSRADARAVLAGGLRNLRPLSSDPRDVGGKRPSDPRDVDPAAETQHPPNVNGHAVDGGQENSQ